MGVNRRRINKTEQHFKPNFYGDYANYFLFKPGSYWIYKNNRTGDLDTCTITNFKRDTSNFYDETDLYKRWLTQEVIDFNVYTTSLRTVLSYTTARPCLKCTTFDSSIKFVLNRGKYPIVFYNSGTKLNPSKYFASYTVGQETFSEVYRFDVTDDNTLPDWNHDNFNILPMGSSYFWAKDKGLIQIMFKGYDAQNHLDSAYWNLEKYSLIKF